MSLVIDTKTPAGWWRLKFGNSLLLFGLATTMGKTTRWTPKYCPDVSSLLHEYYHYVHTNWIKYIFSWIFRTQYWKQQEQGADDYQVDSTNIAPWIVDLQTRIRSRIPLTIPTATFTHPV